MPCTRNADVLAHRPGLCLEDVDERVPDPPPLLLRVAHAGQPLEELLRARPPRGGRCRGGGGRWLHLVPLVQPEESVVDEDAGEPVADRPMDQHGGDRGVHAAREPADDPPVGPDQLSDPRDLALDEMARASSRACTPQTSNRKLLRISPPRGVCATSGWNWTPKSGRSRVLERGDGDVVARRGDACNPAARTSTWSPWLIQTGRLLALAESAEEPAALDRRRWRGRTPGGRRG